MHETPRKQLNKPNKLSRTVAAVTFAAGSLAMIGSQRESANPHVLFNQQEVDYRAPDSLRPLSSAPLFKRVQASERQVIVGETTPAPPPPPPPPTTTTTTTTEAPTITTTAPPPTTTTTEAPTPSQGTTDSDATDAFTPDWWRCVITPESSGNFSDTSGGFGILVQSWNELGMSGYPGEYSPSVQGNVALGIFATNGGFGPPAWVNSANCGKSG